MKAFLEHFARKHWPEATNVRVTESPFDNSFTVSVVFSHRELVLADHEAIARRLDRLITPCRTSQKHPSLFWKGKYK